VRAAYGCVLLWAFKGYITYYNVFGSSHPCEKITLDEMSEHSNTSFVNAANNEKSLKGV